MATNKYADKYTDDELDKLLNTDWASSYQGAANPEDKAYAMTKRQEKKDYMTDLGTYDPAWDKSWEDIYNNDSLSLYNSDGTMKNNYDLNQPVSTVLNKYSAGAGAAKANTSSSSGGGYSNGSSAPTYQDAYSAKIDEMLNNLLNRQDFAYNAEADPLFQQYKASYTRQGNRAMKDTLGEVAAQTGGLASSYATTAASQANDNYMSQLNDKIPELQQLAYEMYLGDYNKDVSNLGLMQGVSDSQYGRYRDKMGDFYTNREFDYGVSRDNVADANYADEKAYGRYRDTVGDAQRADDTAYNRSQTALDRETAAEQEAYNRQQDTKQWDYTLNERDYQRGQDTLNRQAQSNATAFSNAMTKWSTTGVLDAQSAAVLGIPAGTKTSDYSYRQAELALSNSADSRAWASYQQSVTDSNRNYDLNVAAQNQNTLESNRNYAMDKKAQDAALAKNSTNAGYTAEQLGYYDYVTKSLSAKDPQEALDYITERGEQQYKDALGDELYQQLLSDITSGDYRQQPEEYTGLTNQGKQVYDHLMKYYYNDELGNRKSDSDIFAYIDNQNLTEDEKMELLNMLDIDPAAIGG